MLSMAAPQARVQNTINSVVSTYMVATVENIFCFVCNILWRAMVTNSGLRNRMDIGCCAAALSANTSDNEAHNPLLHVAKVD